MIDCSEALIDTAEISSGMVYAPSEAGSSKRTLSAVGDLGRSSGSEEVGGFLYSRKENFPLPSCVMTVLDISAPSVTEGGTFGFDE